MSRPALAASALVLSRAARGGARLLLLQRGLGLRAMAGYTAFPGGVIDAGDSTVPVQGLPVGDAAAAIVCAARETFEEVGILAGAPHLDAGTLAELRTRLARGELTFGDLLGELGITLRAEEFEPCGRWQTPPISPRRFDTLFFHHPWHGPEELSLAPGEVEEAGWVTPAEAMADWREGRRLMVPPVRSTTSAFVEGVQGAAARATAHPWSAGQEVTLIDPHQDARMVPLQTSTLPPFTHTNCMVLGDRELLVVDPAGATPESQAVLDGHLERLTAEGRELRAVVLTHQHPDHVGGVDHVTNRWGLPLWAHEETAQRIDSPVQRTLEDGEVLELGGEHVTRWQILHVPGHAYGHLCLLETTSRTLVSGDNVLGIGTTLINPPEGDMAIYLASLERLRAAGVRTVLPGHGPPIFDGEGRIVALVRHRQMREAKVLGALDAADSPADIDALLPRAYDDVDPAVMGLAARSLLAHLEKLIAEGRVTEPHPGSYTVAGSS